MNNELKKKRLIRCLKDCHNLSLEIINIVSESAISQMQIEGKHFDLNYIQPIEMAQCAARHLNIDTDFLTQEYIDMMLLEKMIEIEQEKTTSL